MKKILGVIGGMGPEATAYFYEEIIAHTGALKDQDHIDMVILSHASMPDRTEAIISFVPVFPTLPITPITGISSWLR